MILCQLNLFTWQLAIRRQEVALAVCLGGAASSARDARLFFQAGITTHFGKRDWVMFVLQAFAKTSFVVTTVACATVFLFFFTIFSSAADFFAETGRMQVPWYTYLMQGRGQYYQGKTYIVYEGHPALSGKNDPCIVVFDHANNVWDGPVWIADSPQRLNDTHGNPGMVISRDGTIHVFFGSHGGGTQYYVSRKPGDINGGWMRRDDFNPASTYNQVHLLDNGNLFYTSRNGVHGQDWNYHISTDNGTTWGPAVSVIDGLMYHCPDSYTKDCPASTLDECWYATTRAVNNEVHYVYTEHPHKSEYIHREDIYYLKVKENGDVVNIEGVKLNILLPLNKAESKQYTLVKEMGPEDSITRFVPFVEVDPQGNPYMGWRVTETGSGEVSYCANWTESAWRITPVPGSGAFRASGHGVVINYCTVDGNGEEWITTDNNQTWSRVGTFYSGLLWSVQILAPGFHSDAFLVFANNESVNTTALYLYGASGLVRSNGISNGSPSSLKGP